MECTKNKTRIVGLAYIAMLPLLGALITFIPLKSNAVVELPFLIDTQHTRILAFGGFPDCASACPLNLSILQQTYIDYEKTTGNRNLGVVFINIRRNMPDELSSAYIKGFHQDFEAYSTTSNDTKNLYTKLALETFDKNENITNHKGHIYLFKALNNKWHIERVFTNDIKKKALLKYLINHPV